MYCWDFYFESLQHCHRLLLSSELLFGKSITIQSPPGGFKFEPFILNFFVYLTWQLKLCWLTSFYIVRVTRLNPPNNGADANGWKLKNSSSDVTRTPKLLNIFPHPENGAAEHCEKHYKCFSLISQLFFGLWGSSCKNRAAWRLWKDLVNI